MMPLADKKLALLAIIVTRLERISVLYLQYSSDTYKLYSDSRKNVFIAMMRTVTHPLQYFSGVTFVLF